MAVSFLSKTIFEDNVKLVFGDGEDLQIYHDGSSSRIGDAGTGNLIISGTNLHLTDTATGEYFFKGTSNGAVQLYYNGTEKFITTSTGIDVTGTVNLDNLTINGGQGSDGQVLTSTGSGVAWEDAASGGGTVTSVGISPGTGLDVSGSPVTSSGNITLNLDLSEFTDMTGDIDPSVDEIILLDNGSERRKRFAEIFGSNAYNSTTIPTNNNQLTNGAGYITDGNTGWNNTYGFITASSTDTLTNKSGNISQWTNDSGYITSSSLPTVNNGTLTLSTSAGLDGSASFTANQSGNSTFTVSLDLSELTDMTAAVSPTVDEIILLDNGAERRKRFSEIFGSNAYNSTTIPTNNNQLTNGAGYITSFTNNYLNGITKSGNTLTFSVSGTTNQSYTFGSNAFNSTTIPTNNNQLTNGAGYITNSGGTTAATANTVAKRNSSADINARLFRSNYQNQSTISGAIAYRVSTSDNYIRFCNNPSAIRTFIGAGTSSFSGSYNDLSNKPTIPTNNNQLTNGAGYITGYTETDTLATVVARGSSTTGAISTGNITTTGGNVYLNDTNTRITEGSSNAIRLQTNSGYVDVGPQNTSHSHFSTDRQSFYFNKAIYVDTGTIGSYNEDLNLNRAGSSTARLRVTSGETVSDQNFRISDPSTSDGSILDLQSNHSSGYNDSRITFSASDGEVDGTIIYRNQPFATRFEFYTQTTGTSGTISLSVDQSSAYFANKVYAQEFIDRNSTSYKIHPGGTDSRLNYLKVGSTYSWSTNSAYLSLGVSTGNTKPLFRTVGMNSYPTWNVGWEHDTVQNSTYGDAARFKLAGSLKGYIRINSSSVTYSTSSSDERLKKNIETWNEDILSKFEAIEPKKFHFEYQEDSDEKIKGYIAQQMIDKFPEAYPSSPIDDSGEEYYSFDPGAMAVYLMKAVKDLVQENKQLKQRVEALENA